MVAMIISFFVTFLSFNFFMMAHQINGINRLLLGMPLSLYETAINMLDISEEDGPYFDKILLENNLTSYFDYHMKRYADSYQLSFYYYNTLDHSLDLDEQAQAVEVTLETYLVLSKHYKKTMHYEIRSNYGY